MNSIDKLANYVKKAVPFVGEGKPIGGENPITQPLPSTSSPTPVMTGEPGPVGWGASVKPMNVPTQFRLYLDGDFIPGTTVKPEDIKLQREQGPRGGAFVDKRLLQTHQKDLYEQSHGQTKTPAYGGIIINNEGKILIRKAAGKFGFEGMPHSWTLSKGKADKGESPEDAALREVLEETGIKGSITSEVPGHFTSKNSSTKFFLMNVDEDTGKFDDETAEVKWVDPSEALDIFRQNTQKDKNGNVLKDSNGHNILHDSSQRDIEAVAMSMHHHKDVKGDTPSSRKEAMAFLIKSKNKKNFKALTNDLVAHYLENGDLPSEFKENGGKYSLFLKTLGMHTRHATEMSSHSEGVKMGYDILPTLYSGLDKQYGLSGDFSFKNFHYNLTQAWKGAGSSSDNAEIQTLQEVISELSNTPANYMYGKTIPEDVNKDGKPIHRSDAQRDEIIAKFDEWSGTAGQLDKNKTYHLDSLKNKFSAYVDDSLSSGSLGSPYMVNLYIKDAKGANVPSYVIKDTIRDIIKDKYNLTKIGDITAKIKELHIKGVPTTKTPAYAKESKGSINQEAAKGEYSWGEEYDFEDGSVASIPVRDGGQMTMRDDVPSWELMVSRAKAARDARAKLPPKHNNLIKNLGKTLYKAKHGDSTTPTAIDIDREGRGFIREYARHTKAMSRMAMDAAWPDDQYFYIGRKTNSPREIVGDEGLHGSSNISEADIQKIGMAAKGMSVENPLAINVHSTAISGGSFNPTAYDGALWISTKIHKDDVLQIHSLGRLYGANERESIFMNNPERESRVIWTKDGKDHQKWGPSVDGSAGIIPKGLHDNPEKAEDAVFTNGVYNAHLNYKDELEPATSEDDPIVKKSVEQKNNAMQLGSNAGGLYKMKSGANKGKLYYVKHDNPAASANEALSNTLYGIAGIKVPKTNVVKFGGGNALMSEWISDHKKHTAYSQVPEAFKNNSDLQSGFLVDAMLANYDVAGQNWDNIVESGGDIYRLDQGGSLNLRAQGQPKENFHTWDGPYIPELTSMLSPTKAPQASQVFDGMDDKTWQKAAQRVFTLTNSKIQETVEKSTIQPQKMDEMTNTLKKRRDSIINWMVKNKPVTYFSTMFEDAEGEAIVTKHYSTEADGHTAKVNYLHKKYNLLKMELLKATDPQIENLKNKPSLWISGGREEGSEDDELTEDFELSAQIGANQKVNLENINTLMGEQE